MRRTQEASFEIQGYPEAKGRKFPNHKKALSFLQTRTSARETLETEEKEGVLYFKILGDLRNITGKIVNGG